MPLRFEGGSSPIGANVLLIIFLVLSLVCTTVYSSESEDGPLHTIQNGFSSLSAPFQFIGAGISASGNSASTGVEDLSADANTLSQLKQQNEELRNYVSQLEEYRQEAQRLEQLQKLSDSYNMDSVTCHVVGKSNDAWSRTITLDQGSDSGVEPGMPVCGATGIVGQVLSVTPATCEVRLIQDSRSGVAVLVQSNRAQGLLKGSLDGLLYLQDVDSSKKVKVGDVIITSGSGGSYLRGLMVGTVVKVEQTDGESNRTIVVSPNEDADALEEVMVVKKMGTAGALDSSVSSSSSSSSSSPDSSSSSSSSDSSSSSSIISGSTSSSSN
jgi:rod shape-determining protein MreC